MKANELSLMLALDALLEEANVTRAAARMAMSQPAMSAQLARLRRLFDDPLLVPALQGRGMVPTPRAMALRRRLRDALSNIQDLMDGAPDFDPLRSQRIFRLVANDNAASMAGVDLVARIRALGATGIRIAFLQPTSEPAAARLERGDADLAIDTGTGSAMGDDLIRQTLFEDQFMTAQRKNHPRGDGPLDLDAYCRFDHLVVSAEGGGFGNSIDDVLQRVGRRRRIVASVQGYLLAPMFLARTDLFCTLPSRFLKRHAGELDIFETPLALPGFVAAVFWHPRVLADPGHRWLRECLLEVSRPGPVKNAHATLDNAAG